MTIVTLAASLLISCNGNRSDARKSNDQPDATDSLAMGSSDMLYLAVGTYTSKEGSRESTSIALIPSPGRVTR